MCVTSMVMDHYHDKWYPLVPMPGTGTYIPQQQTITIVTPQISAEEVAEFRKLLERAREYDKRMNEPECELESKKSALLKIAEQLGVEINFL